MKHRAFRVVLAAAVAWSCTAVLLAHGGHEHVMGTVKAVDPQAGRLEVSTKDGAVVVVQLNDKTKYLRGTATVEAKELTVGERVVVDAAKEKGALVAREIRLPAAKARPSPAK
jgi:hypothetical protein